MCKKSAQPKGWALFLELADANIGVAESLQSLHQVLSKLLHKCYLHNSKFLYPRTEILCSKEAAVSAGG